MTDDRKTNLRFMALGSVFTLVQFIFFLALCRFDRITYDSSYQYSLNLHSLKEIFELLPRDYSPPLYSVLLKGYSSLLGHDLITLRLLSCILLSTLFFLALFPLRRLAGKYAAVVAAVLFLTSSYNLFFNVEIRPTILAYVLTTGLFIYAALMIFDNRKIDTVVFTILASLCMYTHNVSLITAFFVYGFAVILTVIIKQYDLLRKFLISGIIVSILYIPWLIVLINQFRSVLERYWSEHHSLGFGFYITFFGITENNLNIVLSIIPITAIVFIPFINLLFAIDKSKLRTARHINELIRFKDLPKIFPNLKKLLLMIALVCIPLIGFYVFTITVLPVFALRYIYILSGGGIICIAMLATLCASRGFVSKIPAIILSALMGLTFICNFISEYKTFSSTRQHQMIEDVYSLSDGEPVLMDYTEQCLGVLSYTFPNSTHYVIPETVGVLQTFDVFTTDIRYLDKPDDIWEETDSFFIINSLPINDNAPYPPEYYLSYFENTDIVIEEVGIYHLPYCNELGHIYDDYVVYRVHK